MTPTRHPAVRHTSLEETVTTTDTDTAAAAGTDARAEALRRAVYGHRLLLDRFSNGTPVWTRPAVPDPTLDAGAEDGAA